MKIFSVINNYHSLSPHADPEWIILPDSCIVRSGNVFFIPDLDHSYTAFPSLALKIGKLGKSVEPKFAHRYVDEITCALQIADSTLLSALRSKGLPWSRALVFDRSLPLGDFVHPESADSLSETSILATDAEGTPLSEWHAADMSIPWREVIQLVSRTNTIKTGDIVLIALSPRGFTLTPGMAVEASIGSSPLLRLKIK